MYHFSKLSVVVYYDSNEVLDIIEQILQPLFSNLYKVNVADGQESLISVVKQQHESVLHIYAFESPKKSHELRQLFLKHKAVKPLLELPQESLILCAKSERSQAFEYCKNNEFYNYETIKPVYDVGRVRLSVQRIAEYVLLKLAIKSVELEKTAMIQDIESSHVELDQIKVELGLQKSQADILLDQLSPTLRDKIKSVSREQWDQAFSNIVSEFDEKTKQAVDGILSDVTIQPEIEAIKTSNASAFNRISKAIEKSKPPLNNTKPLVLIADDQPVMLKIIASILEPKGFKVEKANNGAEALLKAKLMEPRVILLDIDMPVMDGFRTLDALKKLDQTEQIPVIMLTSHSDKNMFKDCVTSGAQDYIVKPTNADTLLTKISNAIDIVHP